MHEAIAVARSQPVGSLLTILVVAAAVFATMLTAGRTVGAAHEVLASIDAAGTRVIVARVDVDAGLYSDVIDRIDALDGVEWAGAFSTAEDATNAAITDGLRVPVRTLYTADLAVLSIPARQPPGDRVYASPESLELLGLPEKSGAVTTLNGTTYAVAGALTTPTYLKDFEPLVLAPDGGLPAAPIGVVLVVAKTPSLVDPLARAMSSVLAADDPTKVSVETSSELARLRGTVEGTLGDFSRGLVLAIMALTALLVAGLLYGLIMMRRKDYGRRRALGASRGLIVSLVLLQTANLAAVGAVAGAGASLVALLIAGDPFPGGQFTTALGVITIAAALVGAIPPAAIACTREPLAELRVP